MVVLLCGCWKSNLSPLIEQLVLLATEPLSSPTKDSIVMKLNYKVLKLHSLDLTFFFNGMYMNVQVWRSDINIGCLSLLLSTLVLRQDLIETGAYQLSQLAGHRVPRESDFLHSLTAGVTGVPHCPASLWLLGIWTYILLLVLLALFPLTFFLKVLLAGILNAVWIILKS